MVIVVVGFAVWRRCATMHTRRANPETTQTKPTTDLKKKRTAKTFLPHLRTCDTRPLLPATQRRRPRSTGHPHPDCTREHLWRRPTLTEESRGSSPPSPRILAPHPITRHGKEPPIYLKHHPACIRSPDMGTSSRPRRRRAQHASSSHTSAQLLLERDLCHPTNSAPLRHCTSLSPRPRPRRRRPAVPTPSPNASRPSRCHPPCDLRPRPRCASKHALSMEPEPPATNMAADRDDACVRPRRSRRETKPRRVPSVVPPPPIPPP